MAIFLQVREPFTRVELVDLLHAGSSKIQVPGFEWLTDPQQDTELHREKPNWSNPNVGGFRFKGYANPVVYQRQLQPYWESVLLSPPKDPKIVHTIQQLQNELRTIDFRADSLLMFVAGDIMSCHHLGDYEMGSPESQILLQFSDYLLRTSPKIERAAMSAMNLVYEVKLQ